MRHPHFDHGHVVFRFKREQAQGQSEMIVEVSLRPMYAVRHRVHRSKGNFNNHFGLPLGLLTLEPEYDMAVIEMGMSHAGEIAALARIAQPNEAVVTSVGPVHLEFFESVAGIARAKYELIEALPHGGIAVL